jgi:hypothetical protein
MLLYMTISTLALLLPSARGTTPDNECWICGLLFYTGTGEHGGRQASLVQRRKIHEQQHHVSRVCGCLEGFPLSDQIRRHRRKDCVLKKTHKRKSGASNKYPPVYLCDRAGFSALKSELAGKNLLPPGACSLSFPEDNQIGMINSGRKL